MKVLFLPNWTVKQLDRDDLSIQAPDKQVRGVSYWFFKYLQDTKVSIIDIHRDNILHALETRLKFYIWQPIVAFFKANRFDVVISHGAQSGLLYELLSSFFRRNPQHVIIDVGGLNGAKRGFFSRKILSFILRKRPRIIIHSSAQISLYQELYPFLVDRVLFIPFGVDYDYFSRDTAIDSLLSNNIVSFGYAKRDYNTLCESWSKLNASQYRLSIIGDDRLSSSYPNSSIEFISKMPLFELMNQIKQARFVIIPLPEFNYSYGQMSFLQSMCMGKVLIVTRTTSSQDYLENAPGVFLVEPYSEDDMREKIRTVLTLSNEELIDLGRQNQNFVNAFFSEDKMAHQLSLLFKDIM